MNGIASVPPVVASIAVVWAVLLGSAHVCRVAGAGRRPCAAVVTALYLVLSALSLRLLGMNRDGVLGALGMSLPYVAALILAVVPRSAPRSR